MKVKFLRMTVLALMTIIGLGSASAQQYSLSVGDKVSTESGTYIVKGENLITNPSFDDGLTGWYAGDGNALSSSHFEVVSEGGADGGAYLKALSSNGSAKAESIKTSWDIESNKTYVLHFWAWRSAVDGNAKYSRIYVGSTEYTQVKYVAGEWNENTVVFESGEATVCMVNFGWLNKASYFDCFTLAEVELSDELNTDPLEAEITTAQTLLSSTEEGTGKGQYSAEARATLQAAIDAAQAVVTSASSQTEVNDAVATLKEAEAAYKEAANPPFQVGVNYTITQISGSVLGYKESSEYVVVCDADGSENQQFQFVTSETSGAYYIKNVGTGKYVAKSTSSNWNTCWVDEMGSAEAQWKIAEYSEDVYTLQCVANSKYLGSDNTSDGSPTYCDKAASANNSHWTLTECSASGIINAVVEKAQKLLDETEVGTEYYQVPQSAADALLAAIETAKAAIDTATIAEATEVAATLQAAIDEFLASYNPMSEFDTSLTYTITHYGGNLLTATTSGNATITAIGEESKPTDEQKMYLESAGESFTYYIRSEADTYLAYTGDYNTEWTAEKSDACIFKVEQLSGKYLGLYNTGKGAYFGTDATSSGSYVYSDKAAVQNSYWTIASFDDISLDKTLYNAALAKVDEFKATMTEGYDVGEYLPEVISEFNSLITSLKSSAKKAQTQEELDQIAADIEAAVETYKAKANTSVVINRTYLAAAIKSATTIINSATVGDCDGNYPQDALDAYNTALASAQAVYDDETKTQDEVDAATEALKEAGVTFAAQKVVVDFSALSSAIAEAKKVISDNQKYKGEGAGSYPSSAFDALQAVIDEASAIVNSKTHNQAAVDAETGKVEDAVTTFYNTWVPLDLSELTPLLEALKNFRDTNTITLDADDQEALDNAIAAGEAALKATDQSEIDKAVKLLSREYRYFTDLVTAIDSIIAGNSVEGAQIYNLRGVRLDSIQKGINIIRLKNGKNYKVLVK